MHVFILLLTGTLWFSKVFTLLGVACLMLKFRCYEAKIEKVKRPEVAGSWTQDTSGLSRQSSGTEPRQPDNHQPLQSSIWSFLKKCTLVVKRQYIVSVAYNGNILVCLLLFRLLPFRLLYYHFVYSTFLLVFASICIIVIKFTKVLHAFVEVVGAFLEGTMMYKYQYQTFCFLGSIVTW